MSAPLSFLLGALSILAVLLLASWIIRYLTRNTYQSMVLRRRGLLDKHRAAMYGEGRPLKESEFEEMSALTQKIAAKEINLTENGLL